MIGIQLEGDSEFLDISPDTTLQLRLENPLLADAERLSPGSFSLPFDLPTGDSSPKNAGKLKNPDVIANNEAYVLQKAKLFFDGHPYKQGNLKSQIGNPTKTSNFFTFGLNSINPEMKNAKLRDVLNENIVISTNGYTKCVFLTTTEQTFESIINININGSGYNGPLGSLITVLEAAAIATLDTGKYMPIADFTSVVTPVSGLFTGAYVSIVLARYDTVHDPVTGLDFHLFSYSNDPLGELSLTINESEDESNYLIESFNMDGYYDDFDTFFNGYITGAYPTEKFRIPAFFNAKKYSDDGIHAAEIINAVNADGIIRNTGNSVIELLTSIPNWNNTDTYHPDGTGAGRYCKYSNVYWLSTQTSTNQAPPTAGHLTNNYWMKLKWKYQAVNNNSIQPFLRRKWIIEKIASTFGFELEGDFYNHPDFVNMLEYNTTSLDVPQSFIGNQKFVFWRRNFNLNELVPDIGVIEYLKQLQSRYNLGIYFNEETKKVRLTILDNVIKSRAYNDITPLSSPLKPIEDKRVSGYNIICERDKYDEFSYDESLTVGIAEDEIKMQMGGIQSTSGAVISGKYIPGPYVKQVNGSDFTLRTFYYSGIIDNGSFQYPACDVKGTTINERITTFIFALGIYDTFYKHWLNAKKNWRLAKVDVDYPLRMLINFDWELKRRHDRSNFIVAAIDVRITTRKIEVSNIELLTT